MSSTTMQEVPFTASSIKECPDLIMELAKEAVRKMSPEAIRNAEIIVGICSFGKLLSEGVAALINQTREVNGRKDLCQTGITEVDKNGFFYKGAFPFPARQLLKLEDTSPPIKGKKAVFVYVAFELSSDEMKEKQRLALANAFSGEDGRIEKFIKNFGGELLEAVLLPAPTGINNQQEAD